MKVGLPDTHLHQRRRLASVTHAMRTLLVVFCLLTESACLGNIPGTKTIPTPTETTTHLGNASDTKTVPMPTEASIHQDSAWKLVWNDEFDGPEGAFPDPHKWTPDVAGNGWYHQQLDYDTNNQNVYQDGKGNLVLEARKSNPTGYQCWYGACEYTSARITTRDHFSFTYGLLEARIKIPYGQGIWSAFWLLGNNCAVAGWPNCGEIDLMENIGREPGTIYGTAHSSGHFSSPYKLEQGAFSHDFHIFALQWNPDHLYFFVDGISYYTVDRATITNQAYWVYDHPFEIILNLAVGGEWPGNPDATTIFPQKMYISYLRLYTDK